MDKDEILEKSRRDNGDVDERFKIMEQRVGYAMLGVMAVGLALLYLWDFFHGLETSGLSAVLLAGIAGMGFYRFYQLRMKGLLFLAMLGAFGAIGFAVQHILATM